MLNGMGNMQGMMKKVQKMQKEMVAEQEKLAQQEFIGKASNDLVLATLTGDRKMTALTIDPAIIDKEDPDMLQDLIIAAVNDALTKIERTTEATLGKYTKGIPGM